MRGWSAGLSFRALSLDDAEIIAGIAASAFLVTNTSACVGALTWMFIEWIVQKKPTLLGLASGLVAGLVGITPAAGFVDLSGAFAIGIGSGLLGYLGVAVLKPRLGFDDSLDAFGVHGVGGTLGALLTGVFASADLNPAVSDGLLFGGFDFFLKQVVGVLAILAFSFLPEAS